MKLWEFLFFNLDYEITGVANVVGLPKDVTTESTEITEKIF